MLKATAKPEIPSIASSNKQGRAAPGQRSGCRRDPALLSFPGTAVLCTKRQMLLGGASLLMTPLLTKHAAAKPSAGDPSSPSFDGFDGVGGKDIDYANAELQEIAVGSNGGVASVHVEGYDQLMPIFIGVAEAAALVYATTGGEGRRPSTLGTWKRSLEATGSKVERVVITRLENHTYYSRIVLLLPGGIKRSVDSRPSDSLALALQCEAPLFVARQIAREQQGPTIDDALEELQELASEDPEAFSQEAGLGRAPGMHAIIFTEPQRLTV